MWFLIAVLAILSTFFYSKFIKPIKYWHTKGVVVCSKPVPIFGNFAACFFRIKALGETFIDINKKYSNHRYVGFYQFNKPVLIVQDLELIKQITIKDFDVFPDRKIFGPTEIDPLWGKSLLQLTVKDGWHSMRATLSPLFTGSKMKSMFLLMQTCAQQFIDHFKNKNEDIVEENVKDSFTKFSNDIIGTIAFGVTCNSFQNPQNQFYLMGKKATDFTGIKNLKMFGLSVFPAIMKLLGIKFFSNNVSNFFRNIITESISYRKTNNFIRQDMIHLMLEAQKLQKNCEEKQNKPFTELTDESMTAQALIFFFAGFETVSSVMSFTAYELAVHRDVQKKLFKEIQDTVGNGNRVTYEALHEMKYLDGVVSESLRLHTPIAFMERESVKPYIIKPILPGENPLHLESGTKILIPSTAIHKNKRYFCNPEKFDPERFNDENRSKIVPFSYLPFGCGPRNCIGFRFALLEIKLVLVEILQNFEIVPCSRTQIPFQPGKFNFNGVPDDGIWLAYKRRV